MNPGYVGRSELPDNLKALFRPCAMMVPEYHLIGEIVLYSYGFEDARNLAQKTVTSLRLGSEQLSSQDHYDFGMRALKSILVRAGTLRRTYSSSERSEAVLALSALNDVNLPKLTTSDIPLFQGVARDLFVGVQLPPSDCGMLIHQLDGSAKELGLQPERGFIVKCTQLWETILVRHGVMLVGETASGKTEVENVLANALGQAANGDSYLPVQIHRLNPKAVTQGLLYGMFDASTHEWTEGVLAVTLRFASTAQLDRRQWVLLDGPVDAIWVENMNTLLDDNKKLCLSSGENIKMSSLTTMVFEVEDLAAASLATVSRCGMIYLEQVDIGWRVLVLSWLDKLGDTVRDGCKSQFRSLFFGVTESMGEIISRKVSNPVLVSMNWLVLNTLRLCTAILSSVDKAKLTPFTVECCFWFSIVWSFGCATDTEGRLLVNDFVRDAQKGSAVKDKYALLCDEPEFRVLGKASFPEAGTVFDYHPAHQEERWLPWSARVTDRVIPRDAPVHSINVPTVDTASISYLLHSLIGIDTHVLFCGPSGTGKTSTVNIEMRENINTRRFSTMSLSFSAQTTACQTQDAIDSKLEKRRKRVYGPPFGKRYLVFIDDLSMPQKETYGAQPPIELLRQWMDIGGWFDRKTVEFCSVQDLTFIGAMGTPGSTSVVTARYLRHYSLIYVVPLNKDSLQRIFNPIASGFLAKFPVQVSACAHDFVKATVDLFSVVSASLLPTPSRSHYTFNIRDISKIHQGLYLCNEKSFFKADGFWRFWAHECQRVFQDRLIDQADHTRFMDMIRQVMLESFSKGWTQVVRTEPLIFGDFQERGQHREVTDLANLKRMLQQVLDTYNESANCSLDLVFFQAAVEHVGRIVRLLRIPHGSALLVGVGGSGRKSLTLLSTLITDHVLFRIDVSKSYSVAEWHDDLRRLTMQSRGFSDEAALSEKEVTFLLTDTDIVQESFIGDVCCLLEVGEVPNLLNAEDKSRAADVIGSSANYDADVEAEILAKFRERSRCNLHLVLAVSPIGEAFRRRVRTFPAIVNCCTIDWFMEWPDAALRDVARQFLCSNDLSKEVRSGVEDICVKMQKSVFDLARRYLQEVQRHCYVTPTSYLELIGGFNIVLQGRRSEVQKLRSRYDDGLEKLWATEKQVKTMSADLENMRPLLKKSSEDTVELLKNVNSKQEEAATKHLVVEKEEKVCEHQAEDARVIRKECKLELDTAMPALEQALDALRKLKKSDISEVKAMKSPPDGVILVSKAICWFFDVMPKRGIACDGRAKVEDYWEASKKSIWSDTRLLDRFMRYDKDNIPEAIMQKLRPLLDDPSFDPEVVRKSSLAAFGICKWIRAMIKYDRSAKIVAPKRAQLEKAEITLAAAEAELLTKKEELDSIQSHVATLLKEFEEVKSRKDELELQIDDCSKRLARAERLIKGLGGEKSRWLESSQRLSTEYANLTGDVLISSGIIAYLGAFLGPYRQATLLEWLDLMHRNQVPASSSFALRSVIGDEVVIRQWLLERLPNDKFSIENALILSNSRRWPLMIDPQMQANLWIRRRHQNELMITRLTYQSFLRDLEISIRFGKEVLIENVDESLDPSLEPILQKATFRAGNVMVIRFADSQIEYNSDFLLYITTKMANPHFSPEICVQITLLNFMATPHGLHDQLLSLLVSKEEPESGRKLQHVMIQSAQSKAELKEIEDRILQSLSNAKGNILDDEELVCTLANSKIAAQRIEDRVAEQDRTRVHIQETHDTYIPVATRASALFFILADLAKVDLMYQNSLEWFNGLYNCAIDTAANFEGSVDKRIQALQTRLLQLVYQRTCISLFEKDKFLFSLMLCFKCMEVDKELHVVEKQMLLLACAPAASAGVGSGKAGYQFEIPKPDANWLSDLSWGRICSLVAIGKGPWIDLAKVMHANIPVWRRVFESEDPLKTPWPHGVKETMSPLQRALFMFAFRTDRTVAALQEVVAAKLGNEFLEPPAFNLERAFKDSVNDAPMLFILSRGADPMRDVARLGQRQGMSEMFRSVSLGQAQGPKAERAIADGIKDGSWVFIQNCHLAQSWMPKLEVLVEELPEKVKSGVDSFRLWLTTMPSPDVPVSVLQASVKMTCEQARGLRTNLLRSYMSFDSEWFHEACSHSEDVQKSFRKLLFGLCFFHAVVQERCTYGSIGWNIPYEFSEADRQISASQLKLFLEENLEVPFAALRYTTAEANYGGRVIESYDRRTICFILEDLYCPAILTPGYTFSSSGIYHAPAHTNLEGYIKYIRSLPLNHTPEAFGLHPNANLTAGIGDSMKLINTLRSLEPRASTKEPGRSPDAVLVDTSNTILKDLPDLFDIEHAMAMHPANYFECMNTVLTQDLARFNKLLVKVRTTLADVCGAFKGLLVMSSELELVATGLLLNVVPMLWKAVSYPSTKPLNAYVTDLRARLHYFQDWIDKGIHNGWYWLSAFFFIQAFLTGQMQNFARQQQLPIDILIWDFRVLDRDTHSMSPNVGCIIHGIFMEGARWDSQAGVVADSYPSVLYSKLPPVLIVPSNSLVEKRDTSSLYPSPLYTTSERRGQLSTTGRSSNLVSTLLLPMDGQHNEKFWTKRGVACLTQLDN
eukprot:TRINITY_DN17697_c0_g4_i1.p1 TRINITY_DN17697_c0_g4~~TRINITY_DN17697_c0_g4_i1.p1  ORF type:complete len:2583 (+),score=405.07 TRINITY_DN17697_c0_g4_i1:3-7751(+)